MKETMLQSHGGRKQRRAGLLGGNSTVREPEYNSAQLYLMKNKGKMSRTQLERWKRRAAFMKVRVPEYHAFDSKGRTQYGFCRLEETICDEQSPCCRLIILYAKMGLHRYNWLQGENYHFRYVQKYNLRKIVASSSYYITFDAMNPATDLLQTFQTKVDEYSAGTFLLTCYVARPRAETKITPGIRFSLDSSWDDWPTDDPFEKFEVVKNSRLQDNAWIRLYLELAVATTDRNTMDHDLSNLEIVNVAIDTSQDPDQGLNAETAVVYISYKDSCEARVGKDVDRIAMIRRSFDEDMGCFSLVGQQKSSEKGANQSEKDSGEAGVGKDVDSISRSFSEQTRCFTRVGQDDQSSEIIPKKCKNQRAQLLSIRRLGVLKPLRLSSPRWHKAYKNRGVGLARRLHKTRSI